VSVEGIGTGVINRKQPWVVVFGVQLGAVNMPPIVAPHPSCLVGTVQRSIVAVASCLRDELAECARMPRTANCSGDTPVALHIADSVCRYLGLLPPSRRPHFRDSSGSFANGRMA
jgi:hypothetical protein